MREHSILGYNMTGADGADAAGIIPVGRIFDFWGDAETEIMILNDGDESLCLGYDNVKFYDDVFVGDQMDFKATMVKKGNTSRTLKLEAFKLATPKFRIEEGADPMEMHFYEEPKLVGEGNVILVVREEKQRGRQPDGEVKDPWGDLD